MKTGNSSFSEKIARSKARNIETAEAEKASGTGSTFIQPEPVKVAQINARVGVDFRDDVKLYCTLTGMSVQDLVIEAITEYMQSHPHPSRP